MKAANKIKKGDRIVENGIVFTVTKKSKGYGADEVKFTINADEDLDPDFERYATYKKDSEIETA